MMKVVIDAGKIDKNFKYDLAKLTAEIIAGKCKIYTGGTKYKSELTKAGKAFLLAMEKAGKTIKVEDAMVDAEQRKIERIFSRHKKCVKTNNRKCKKPCDDPHLFALMHVANTNKLVSNDKRILSCYKCIRKDGGNYSNFSKPRILVDDDDCTTAGLI